jgi:hypothetical protein
MKTKNVYLIILLLIVAACVVWSLFYQRYELKPISKFTIPGITLNPNHRVLDGYAVSFALSDSLIYVTDASDTTHTKSYCYSYSGQPNSGFHFPTDKGYGEVFVDRNLYYLPQSNLLAYVFWQNRQIDYYTTDGKYVRSENPFLDQTVGIYNIAEYNHSVFINSMGYFKNTPISNIQSMRVYKKQPNQAPVVFKNINFIKDDIKNHISYRRIMMDDNGKDVMILLENQYDKPHASLYRDNTTTEFEIKTPKVFGIYFMGKLPLQVDKGLGKEPYQLVLGQDFLIIGSWRKLSRDYPLVQKIYNLKGRYLGKLKFKDDPQNEVIDIISDKLVAFNPAKGVVSIYRIRVK